MGELLEWRTVSGRGTIYSYSIVRRAPSQAFADVPYTVALVDLDEGVRMMARVSDISENVRIGATVKVIFVTRGEYSVPEFKLWDKSSTGLG